MVRTQNRLPFFGNYLHTLNTDLPLGSVELEPIIFIDSNRDGMSSAKGFWLCAGARKKFCTAVWLHLELLNLPGDEEGSLEGRIARLHEVCEEGELVDVECATSWRLAAVMASNLDITYRVQSISCEFLQTGDGMHMGWESHGKIISHVRLLAVTDEVKLDESLRELVETRKTDKVLRDNPGGYRNGWPGASPQDPPPPPPRAPSRRDSKSSDSP
jgi:hypothetical protein